METKKTNGLYSFKAVFLLLETSKIIVLLLFSTESGWVILKQKVGIWNLWAPSTDFRAFVGGE